MPCFGGVTPFPRRMGGGRPRARAILDSLNGSRGTGLDTSSWSSNVYCENVVCARAIAAAWSTNQRLANIWDSRRVTGHAISRWETIRHISPNYGDSDNARRARIAGVEALAGITPTTAVLESILSARMGDAFVAVETISLANANIVSPDASYPFGHQAAGVLWSSTVAHILVRTTKPAGMSDAQFYDAVGIVQATLDPIVPAWAYFDWYREPETGAAISVTGGPSAAGFYLDERNLDNSVFDV